MLYLHVSARTHTRGEVNTFAQHFCCTAGNILLGCSWICELRNWNVCSVLHILLFTCAFLWKAHYNKNVLNKTLYLGEKFLIQVKGEGIAPLSASSLFCFLLRKKRRGKCEGWPTISCRIGVERKRKGESACRQVLDFSGTEVVYFCDSITWQTYGSRVNE